VQQTELSPHQVKTIVGRIRRKVDLWFQHNDFKFFLSKGRNFEVDETKMVPMRMRIRISKKYVRK